MGDQSINYYQDEISVLNRLLAVQNVIHVFTSIDKIADFSAASLKLVPGIQKCSFCLYKHKEPFGDFFDASSKLAERLSRISDYRKNNEIQLPFEKNLIFLNLQTTNFFFGYVLIVLNDLEEFERYRPAVCNSMNIVAIILENHVQNVKIKEHKQQLEEEVEKRTAELREEIAKNLHSQKALKESESLIKSISDNLDSGMIFQLIWNKDGSRRFTYLSDSVRQICGVSPEDGMADASLIYSQLHTDDLELLVKRENEAAESLSVLKVEVRFIDPMGGIKWSSIVSNSRKIDDNTIIFEGIYFIITEHKLLEKALGDSENKIRAILDYSFGFISLLTPEGILIEVNNTALDFAGISLPEIAGKLFWETPWWSHSDEEKAMVREAVKIAANGIFVRVETTNVSKDGQIFAIDFTLKPVFDEKGEVIFLIPEGHDITERKRAEETLQKFRLGIERSPEAVFITDTDGSFTYANPAFTDIYGYTLEDISGLTPRILKSGLYSPEIYKSYWDTLLSKKPVEGEIINRRKDGCLITIEGVNNPILDKEDKIIGFLGIHRDVTKRKEKDEALRSSEERFRKAFITSPDSVNINRLSDGMFESINDGFTKLTGYSTEETIGKTSAEINIWADMSDRTKMVDSLSRDGFVKNLEAKFRMKDGSLRTGLMSSSLLDFKGIPHVLSITRDIEEIKKTQDALKESEERFKQVAENAGDWIWEVDANGLYKYSSPAVEKLLGYKPSEIIDKLYFYDLFSPEIRDTIKNEAFKVFAMKGKFFHFQNKNRRKDGSIVVLDTSGSPILDSDGNLIGYRGIDSDVTERLQFIENLHKLSVAVEQSPASIVITDLRGEIEYVNPRFTQMTGYTFEEAKGNNPRILKSGHTKREVYTELWSKISSGKEWKGEFYNRKKNGDFFWEAASISPIIDESGKITHYIAVKEDITDKKEATRKIFDAIIETEERERQRYSHELHDGLGPILSTIRLYFEMLAENTETVHKDVIIARTGNCIKEAIQTIKEISFNLSPSVLSNFGIISGIKNFISRVNETGKLFIEFETNTDQRFDKTVEVALYRIITELINNTVKYSGATAAKITMNLSGNRSYIKFGYSDNGCGFDLEEVLSRGKGLGLSNIYQRISTLNGKINIVTASGKGISVLIEIQLS
jgi:PAS domain S-box-containing protein